MAVWRATNASKHSPTNSDPLRRASESWGASAARNSFWSEPVRPCASLWRPLGRLRRRLCLKRNIITVRPMVRARHLGRHFQRTGGSRRYARSAIHRQQLHQGSPLRRRRKRGLAHGIGRTKGGRKTKLHAVCDERGRPCVLLLTPGNVHDCKVAQLCIAAMPAPVEFVADKGYDSQELRERLLERGT